MATYNEIRDFVKAKYGYKPKDCWIAHAKELSGIPVNRSHRRKGERKVPCPPEKLASIQEAFRHFEMID